MTSPPGKDALPTRAPYFRSVASPPSTFVCPFLGSTSVAARTILPDDRATALISLSSSLISAAVLPLASVNCTP